MPSDDFIVESAIVSARTGEPMVNLRFMGKKLSIPVKEAREIAIHILEAAEAATQDSIVLDMLMEKAAMTPEMAMQFVQMMRGERERRGL